MLFLLNPRNTLIPHILAVSSANPQTPIYQKNLALSFIKNLSLNAEEAKKLQLIFNHSAIDKRYSILSDFADLNLQGKFFGTDFLNTPPDVSKRNKVYIEEAPKLAHEAAAKAIIDWGNSVEAITHIISVSCTGMYAPGIETSLIKTLGLNPHIERLGINFMGCFGAFKGLAIAKAIAKEDPKNRILLVCTELCSLHFQSTKTSETFVSNALFGDGAAAALIGCLPKKEERSLFTIENTASFVLEESEKVMTWEVGNTGMLMKLSPKIPFYIKQHIADFSRRLIGDSAKFSSCTWAIHPGGKAIIESIESACDLKKDQTEASWKVLKNYGNMSSATFLFVLEEIREKKAAHDFIIGLGFGPGLSMEGILLKPSGCRL